MTDPANLEPAPEPAATLRLSPHRQLWQRWRNGERPDVHVFLASAGARAPAQLVAVLRVDQQERWHLAERVPAEEYLGPYPVLRAGDDAADLIYGEYLLREERGETPSLEEYVGRFQTFAAQLEKQFKLHRALEQVSGRDSGDWASLSVWLRDLSAPEPQETPAPGGWPAVAGYEILGELGRGGMGIVYKARQTGLQRLVALKMILAGAHAGAEELARFRREAEVAAALQHPNIVQIFEIGEQSGRPYFSQELVEGDSLAQHLSGKPQPAVPAAQLVETLARAIHYVHQKGVIHRDLKPANVLLGISDLRFEVSDLRSETSNLRSDIKITDFGLAKRLEGGDGQTRTGAILGTPSYMAPEQAEGRSRDIGPATDVYALGAVLYEMLTGRPPFVGESAMDALLQVRYQDPVPPSRLEPRIPRDLETICLKCLEKDPRRRYPRALDLAEDLNRFVTGDSIRARPVTTVEWFWRRCRRNPGIALLAAALAGVAITLLVTLVSLDVGVAVLVALLLGAAALASTWTAWQLRRTARREQHLRTEAEQAQHLAEERARAEAQARAKLETNLYFDASPWPSANCRPTRSAGRRNCSTSARSRCAAGNGPT